jgi:hypothetical protein
MKRSGKKHYRRSLPMGQTDEQPTPTERPRVTHRPFPDPQPQLHPNRPRLGRQTALGRLRRTGGRNERRNRARGDEPPPTNNPRSSPTRVKPRDPSGAPTPAPSSPTSCADPPAAPAQFLSAPARTPPRFHTRPTDRRPRLSPSSGAVSPKSSRPTSTLASNAIWFRVRFPSDARP